MESRTQLKQYKANHNDIFWFRNQSWDTIQQHVLKLSTDYPRLLIYVYTSDGPTQNHIFEYSKGKNNNQSGVLHHAEFLSRHQLIPRTGGTRSQRLIM